MKILVLNGTYGSQYESILNQFVTANQKHSVTVVNLENEKIAYCTGCWSCWTKTPGLCAHQDYTQEMLRLAINSDYVIHFTENSVGYATALTKKAMDKFIPLVHPYMEFVNGETHHIKRYETYPQMGLIFVDDSQGQSDFEVTKHLFERMGLNFKSGLPFALRVPVNNPEVSYENFSL